MHAALCRTQGHAEPLGVLFFRNRGLQQVQIAHNNGQQIVKVMRHAAGQLPNRFELLGDARALLGHSAVMDVGGGLKKGGAQAVLVQNQRNLRRKPQVVTIETAIAVLARFGAWPRLQGIG